MINESWSSWEPHDIMDLSQLYFQFVKSSRKLRKQENRCWTARTTCRLQMEKWDEKVLNIHTAQTFGQGVPAVS